MAAPSQVNSTITLGGTAQTAMPADGDRRSIQINNESDTAMRFNFIAAASSTAGWLLAAGERRVMSYDDWTEITGALSVYCATTGKAYEIHDDK